MIAAVRRTVRKVLLAALTTIAIAAQAQAAITHFDLPVQPLADSLRAVGSRTNTNVLFDPRLVASRQASALVGDLTADQALATLLEGTGITYEFLNDKTVLVAPAASSPPEQSETNSSGARHSTSTTQSETNHAVVEQGTSPMQSSAPSFKSFWQRLRLAQAGVASTATEERQETPGVKGNDGEPTSNNSKGIPELLIRGTRSTNVDIPRSMDDIQPYVVIGRKQLERSNAPSLQDFLMNDVSMNAAPSSQEKAVNVLAAPFGNVNLRGLGANQTLILVDGRRMAGFGGPSGYFWQGDVGAIPMSSVERIEILPASAGAIYGGSATGGVINVIRKHNYSGVDASIKYGNTFDRVAGNNAYNLSGGFGAGNTQVTVGFTRTESDPLLAGDRDFAERARLLTIQNKPGVLSINTTQMPPFGSTSNICAGTSFNSPIYGLIAGSCNGATLTLKNGGASLGSSFTYVPVGYAGLGSDSGAAFVTNAGHYNLAAPADGEYLLRDPARTAFSAGLRQTLTSWLEFQADGMKSTTRSELRFPDATYTSSFFVPSTSPSNPFNQNVIVNVPLSSAYRSPTSSSGLIDVQGGFVIRLPARWSASLDRTWSRSEYSYFSANAPRFTSGDISTLRSSDFLFQDVSGSAPALAMSNDPSAASNSNGPFVLVQEGTSLRVGGPVLQLPGGPLLLTGLAEHRSIRGREGLTVTTYLPAANTPPVNAYYPARWQSVNSFYMEANAPLIGKTHSLPFVEVLEVQAAARRDDYRTTSTDSYSPTPPGTTNVPYFINRVGSTDYLFGLKFSPLRDITFRASYNTAFLPPDLNRFSPATEYGVTVSSIDRKRVDPATQQGTSVGGPVDVVNGGNPNVQPETSKSRAFGIIFTPRFVDDLRLSLDYVEIRKADEIGDPTIQYLLDNEDLYASRITRAAPTSTEIALGWPGRITKIDGSVVNALHSVIKDIDFRLDYKVSTRKVGTVYFTLNGTRSREFIRQLDVLHAPLNVVGTTAGPLKWKGMATLEWERGPWDASWTTRYLDRYLITSPYLAQSNQDAAIALQGSAYIPSQVYHDLVVSYVTPESLSYFSGAKLAVGVENVFNTSPPIIVTYDLSTVTSGYSTYGDPRLRRFFISVSKSFGQ